MDPKDYLKTQKSLLLPVELNLHLWQTPSNSVKTDYNVRFIDSEWRVTNMKKHTDYDELLISEKIQQLHKEIENYKEENAKLEIEVIKHARLRKKYKGILKATLEDNKNHITSKMEDMILSSLKSTLSQGYNYTSNYQRILTPTINNNNINTTRHRLSLTQPKVVSLEPEKEPTTTTTTTMTNNNNNNKQYHHRSPPPTPSSTRSIPLKTSITPVTVTPRQSENRKSPPPASPTVITPISNNNKVPKEETLSVEDIEETPVIKLKDSSSNSDDFSDINSPIPTQQQPPPPLPLPSVTLFQNDELVSPVHSLKSQNSNNNNNNNSTGNKIDSNILQEDISSVLDDINDDENNDDYFGRSFE